MKKYTRPRQKGSNQKKNILKGRLRIAGRDGYITTENNKQVIKIDRSDLNTGLNGDVVEVTLKSGGHLNKETVEGKIKRIVSRAKLRFVGRLEKRDATYYVIPDDRKMYVDIKITDKGVEQVPINEKVLVEINSWTDPNQNPLGQIIERLGPIGANETEMQAIALDRGFTALFPEAVAKEATTLVQNFAQELKNEAVKRRDFRSVTTLTIDPETAKDFDDALSIKKLAGDHFEVSIHIADVSHYVTPGSALDGEAANRGTSVYLVDRTIPMLPEELSNNLCSLRPNEDRLAFSAVFELDPAGQIIAEWYGKTIINSDRRLTYEEAQEILDGKREEYMWELKALNDLAYKLRAQKIEAGAITFDDEAVVFKLDDDGRPLSIEIKERTDSHRLVEDFMLLANRQVAEYVSRLNKNRNHSFVYRIHDLPDINKMTELKNFLRPFGFELKIKDDKVSQRELNSLLDQVDETSHGSIVHRAAIRAMAKAVYSTTNIGHWGLAFKYYTHFTSPIRRYPDLMVHRLLDIYLKHREPERAMFNKVAHDVIHSTDMEIKAAEAERESVKLKQVEFMQDKVGETFTGIISGVTKWGLFVEEEKTKADGMIRLENLGNDYFELDEKNYRIVGQKTKAEFRLGDSIKFKIIAADAIKRTLDYSIVENESFLV